jgi:hypothetical protein
VDQLFARVAAGGAVGWYLTDREGSIRDITNNTPVVRDHIDYDGFGKHPDGDEHGLWGRVQVHRSRV